MYLLQGPFECINKLKYVINIVNAKGSYSTVKNVETAFEGESGIAPTNEKSTFEGQSSQSQRRLVTEMEKKAKRVLRATKREMDWKESLEKYCKERHRKNKINMWCAFCRL